MEVVWKDFYGQGIVGIHLQSPASQE